MTRFIFLWRRDGRPLAADTLLPLAAALQLPTQADLGIWRMNYCAAAATAWAEDADRPWPFCSSDGRYIVFFHGRLDEQAALRRQLGLVAESEPALLLAMFLRWGESAFEKIYGAFVAAIYDTWQHSLLCVRDALGDCTLFHYIGRDFVAIAVEPHVLLALPAVGSMLNRTALAHFVAGRAFESAETIFRHINQLPPAHTLHIHRERTCLTRYWQPTVGPMLRLSSGATYAAQFRHHLNRSVQNHLYGNVQIGVKMSGGLDSTALAALAAHAAARPVTFSAVFDRYPQSDERDFITATNAYWQLPHALVTCDDHYAWAQLESWPLDANHPFSDPHERISQALYVAARKRGIRVMVGGYFADNLYQRSVEWIGALLREGRIRPILIELSRQMRDGGWQHPFIHASLRHLLGRTRPDAPAWLNDQFRPIVAATMPSPIGNTQIALNKARMAATAGIELRYPYRDRRLFAFMATVPAYQLYNNLWQKAVARDALHGLLPEMVRWRWRETTLAPLFNDGMRHAGPMIARVLTKRDALWREFVEPRFFVPFDLSRPEKMPNFVKILIWRLVLLELWRERFHYG